MLTGRREVNVFVSYAHKDDAFFKIFKEGLKAHLNTSEKFNFGIWDDSKIHVGSFWDNEIQENLAADLAILCVSANFLNSNYIGQKELGVLINKFPATLLIPVYFNHCQFIRWTELSARQFFKPGGENFGKAGVNDFAFCDLVRFSETDGGFIPNANIDRYFVHILQKIEEALSDHYSGTSSQTPTVAGQMAAIELSENSPLRQKMKLLMTGSVDSGGLDFKVVSVVVILAMILSLGLIFYSLINYSENSTFKVVVGVTMFFGSFAAFIFTKKNVHNKRVAI